LVVGDLTAKAQADGIVTEANGYETENERFVYARCACRDRLPYATLSNAVVRMTGSPSLTFTEVGATGDTITRAAGSWVTDGFAVGDTVTITGTVSNNKSVTIKTLSATIITVADTDDLIDEVCAVATVVGYATLTFAEVGATLDTITRNKGSWLADGFAAGDVLTIAGTVSNNGTTAVVSVATALVLTLTTFDLTPEAISVQSLTFHAGETKTVWRTAMDAMFAAISTEKRIDIARGRARKQCPITQWQFPRPASWTASLREYRRDTDIHLSTWWKKKGPCTGWSLVDGSNNLEQYDERIDGSGDVTFTSLRTYANGPQGCFISRSVTRATDGSKLVHTHNMAVTNLACSTVHAATEQAIGQSLVLNADGTATSDSLQLIESEVNSALEIALLQSYGFGPRCSSCRWEAATDDDLSVPDAVMNGTLTLNLRGTLVSINTTVKV
jgi:hypothetical protein